MGNCGAAGTEGSNRGTHWPEWGGRRWQRSRWQLGARFGGSEHEGARALIRALLILLSQLASYRYK